MKRRRLRVFDPDMWERLGMELKMESSWMLGNTDIDKFCRAVVNKLTSIDALLKDIKDLLEKVRDGEDGEDSID